jgi:hypothetical protein
MGTSSWQLDQSVVRNAAAPIACSRKITTIARLSKEIGRELAGCDGGETGEE